MLVTQCAALYDPTACSPPGSSVHGIFQARILEWVTMPSSGGSSPPRDRTRVCLLHCRQTLYPLNHQGSPIVVVFQLKSSGNTVQQSMIWKILHSTFVSKNRNCFSFGVFCESFGKIAPDVLKSRNEASRAVSTHFLGSTVLKSHDSPLEIPAASYET